MQIYFIFNAKKFSHMHFQLSINEKREKKRISDIKSQISLKNLNSVNKTENNKLYFNSLVAQMVMSLTAMQDTQVWSLGQKDTLEKEMATHLIIFAWKIPFMEEPGRLHTVGLQRVRHDWVTSLSLQSINTSKMINSTLCI